MGTLLVGGRGFTNGRLVRWGGFLLLLMPLPALSSSLPLLAASNRVVPFCRDDWCKNPALDFLRQDGPNICVLEFQFGLVEFQFVGIV